MPIWSGTIVMNVVLAQLQTFTVEQGSTMERKIGGFKFPAASIPVFPLIIMAILVPLYDKAFVPFARRFTGHERGITILQRIGTGLVLSIVSMIIAAVVEKRRIRTAAAHGLLDDSGAATIPMSIFWLVPQYFTFGIADMFTYIGVLEFFYDQAPDTMRSFSTGLSFCTIALGYFISTAVVNLVNKVTKDESHPGWLSDSVPFNRKKIDYFYWLMAVLSFVNFVYFLFVACSYKYQEKPVAAQTSSRRQHLPQAEIARHDNLDDQWPGQPLLCSFTFPCLKTEWKSRAQKWHMIFSRTSCLMRLSNTVFPPTPIITDAFTHSLTLIILWLRVELQLPNVIYQISSFTSTIKLVYRKRRHWYWILKLVLGGDMNLHFRFLCSQIITLAMLKQN